LSVRYGGLIALDGVDLLVHQGQLVGLIGPNGAGKTTLIDALTGFTSSTGTVLFEGQSLAGLPAYRRARTGLVRTWQSIELFDDLTIEDNLRVVVESVSGRTRKMASTPTQRPDRNTDTLAQVLQSVGLSHLLQRYPPELSQGERKLVGVARSLAGAPALVCLDEPAAGLDNRESHELGGRLKDIVRSGTSILLVDHDMNLVLTLCDHIEVLDCGRHIASGSPDAVRGDSAVTDAYLGSRHGATEASAR
jgi:branched-chain amino acid transport system ATP-binding protein